MDRRDFLKGALAVSGVTVLASTAKAGPPSLTYVRHYETNIGAPLGTSALFGKHTQWRYCPKDGKIRAYGGDGDWRLQDTGFKQQQSLNAVLAYDFGNGGRLEQETKQWGDPGDGTMPNYHDGCTWVYNSRDDKYYAIPGYPVSRIPSQPDPHQLIKINVVHKFVRATRKWEEGPAVGNNWVPEHWGGAYDPKRNRVWIQCQGQGEFGSLKWFDCEKSTFGVANLRRTSGLARIYNVGYELRTERWPQALNPVTDELICFDGYRGHIVGIALSTLTARVIANVPGLQSKSAEPLPAIETGLTISVRRQKVFVSYSQQSWAVVGGKGGVWSVDLKTGTAEQTPYPTPPGENSSWTGCEYDDTNDCLILAGNYDRVWGRRFLRYEFADAAPTRAAEPALILAAYSPGRTSAGMPAWLREAPHHRWIDIPNSQLSSYFVDGKGLSPEYLGELGIAVPTKRDQQVRWGANKHGIRSVNPQFQEWSWSHMHQSHGGFSLDSGRHSGNPSNLLVGGGDTHWADNTVARFVFGVDAPHWEVAVLGCHQREYKNEAPGKDTIKPGDDPRHYRMYDGSDRGGHPYFAMWCIEQRNWHCRFGTHQYWPLDYGYSQTVSIADLKQKRWISEELIADWSRWPRGAETPWKGKHPITEDVYCLQGTHLICWRQAANRWDVLYTRPISWRLDDACGAIAWQHDYLLFSSKDGALGGKNLWWVFENKTKTDVTLTGPDAAVVHDSITRGSAFEWNPDLKKFLFYRDDAVVYTLERVDTATFQVGRLALAGSPSPGGEAFRLRAGGVLNNWQYVPQLKGMIYRVDDRRPMKFFRTG